LVRQVSEEELATIKRQGGNVIRKNRKVPKKERPAPAPEPVAKVEPAPPPTPPTSPEETTPLNPAVLSLVEAQTKLMEHNNKAMVQLGVELKAIALSRNPVPWRMTVERSKKGFIDYIDLNPRTE